MESERSGSGSWNPVAARCCTCEQQDPRYLPYTLVRITEAEMRSYHHFVGSCIRLQYVAKKGTVRAMTFSMPTVLVSCSCRNR
uniref:Uncharacterized protein n=1 Tax=Prolemur simus TaxID=1328070 RepID=A0A8C9DSQ1_PROSS